MAKATYTITNPNSKSFQVTLSGRALWALESLIRAGNKGCTPIEHPAPRWSHYIFLLRGEGILVETITENHGGDFPGHYGRYVLRSQVSPVQQEVA